MKFLADFMSLLVIGDLTSQRRNEYERKIAGDTGIKEGGLPLR